MGLKWERKHFGSEVGKEALWPEMRKEIVGLKWERKRCSPEMIKGIVVRLKLERKR
jgi:hypothetical protein